MLKSLPFYSLKVNFILKYIPLTALAALTAPEDRSLESKVGVQMGLSHAQICDFGKISISLSWEFLNRKLLLKVWFMVRSNCSTWESCKT